MKDKLKQKDIILITHSLNSVYL